MATHSSVLAWRIPGTEEPGGLPSMGSHRVKHDWIDLAAAAAQRGWAFLLAALLMTAYHLSVAMWTIRKFHKIIIPNKPFSVYMKTITNTLAEYLLITKSLQKKKKLSQTFNFLYYSELSTPTRYLLSVIVWFRFGFNLLCQCIFPLPLLKYVKL